MLDIMRKHASSWGIKAILAMIIVSFVLFFGYSRIAKMNRATVRGGGTDEVVARVNHMAIPASEFRFFFDRSLDGVRTRYEGQPVPDFMKQMIERSTLAQLIQRELLLQIADQIGITVTDSELADAIREGQVAMRGSFNSSFYTTQFLPYFQNRFGINYEDMLRNDLRAARVQDLFRLAPVDADAAAPAREMVTRFSFELATIDVDAMIKDKRIASAADAREIARLFADNPTVGQWKQMAAKYGVRLTRVDGVSLKERRMKLPGFSFDDYQAIFALSEDSPVVDTPISRNDNTIAVVRLIERREHEEDVARPADDFLMPWMQGVAARAKISTYLDGPEQPRQ